VKQKLNWIRDFKCVFRK